MYRADFWIKHNQFLQDAIFRNPTTNQAARAANIIHSMLQFRRLITTEKLPPVCTSPAPVFYLSLAVSSGSARPITEQVISVTWPVIGWAQSELTQSKRQKTGPGNTCLMYLAKQSDSANGSSTLWLLNMITTIPKVITAEKLLKHSLNLGVWYQFPKGTIVQRKFQLDLAKIHGS